MFRLHSITLLVLILSAAQVVSQQQPDECGRVLIRVDEVGDSGRPMSTTTWFNDGNQQTEEQVINFGTTETTVRVVRTMDDLGRVIEEVTAFDNQDGTWSTFSTAQVEYLDAKRQQVWTTTMGKDVTPFPGNRVKTIQFDQTGERPVTETVLQLGKDRPPIKTTWEWSGDTLTETRSQEGVLDPMWAVETYKDGRLTKRVLHTPIPEGKETIYEQLIDEQGNSQLVPLLYGGPEQRRKSYEYDQAGNQTLVVREELFEGNWRKTSETRTEFDGCGAVARKTWITFSEDGTEAVRGWNVYHYQSTDSADLPRATSSGLLESIYPNPANTTATLVLKASSGAVDIGIYDATGRHIRTIESEADGSRRQVTIDVNTLLPGVYAIQAKGASGSDARLLTIQSDLGDARR